MFPSKKNMIAKYGEEYYSKHFNRDYLGSIEPNKGNNMNEHDKAFEPMDAATAVGAQSDGTVTYQIVDGDTYLDGKLVGEPKVVGHVQIDEAKVD